MRFILALIAACGLAAAAKADVILQASTLDIPQGGTGVLTVTLQNTGPTAVDLAGYQIQLTTSVPGVQFLGVDRSPAPYLFPGATGPISSDFDPPFFTPPVTTFTATDFTVSLAGFDTVGAGETLGVLSIGVAADPTAPLWGTGSIRFVQPGTNSTDLTQLVDGAGNLVSFSSVDGRVTVVPEPASVAVLLVAGVLGLWLRRHNLR